MKRGLLNIHPAWDPLWGTRFTSKQDKTRGCHPKLTAPVRFLTPACSVPENAGSIVPREKRAFAMGKIFSRWPALPPILEKSRPCQVQGGQEPYFSVTAACDAFFARITTSAWKEMEKKPPQSNWHQSCYT